MSLNFMSPCLCMRFYPPPMAIETHNKGQFVDFEQGSTAVMYNPETLSFILCFLVKTCHITVSGNMPWLLCGQQKKQKQEQQRQSAVKTNRFLSAFSFSKAGEGRRNYHMVTSFPMILIEPWKTGTQKTLWKRWQLYQQRLQWKSHHGKHGNMKI